MASSLGDTPSHTSVSVLSLYVALAAYFSLSRVLDVAYPLIRMTPLISVEKNKRLWSGWPTNLRLGSSHGLGEETLRPDGDVSHEELLRVFVNECHQRHDVTDPIGSSSKGG